MKPWKAFPKDLPYAFNVEASKVYNLLTTSNVSKRLLEVRKQVLELAEEKEFDIDNSEQAALVLKGGTSSSFQFYDNDTNCTYFQQEPFFRYLFGVNEPDAFGLMVFKTGYTIGVLPKLDESTWRWAGYPRTKEYYMENFALDEVVFSDDPKQEVESIVKKHNFSVIYELSGVNTDSGSKTVTTANLNISTITTKVDKEKLHQLLCESRVIKTPLEQELLEACCLVSSQAHVFMMRNVRAGMAEGQLDALFQAWTGLYGGSRRISYGSICCSGPSGAILHYGHAGRPNDLIIRENDMLLLDLGSEYNGYATDITTSYPVSGKFTAKQRVIYQIVYDANQAVQRAMKPGVSWVDMHVLAEQVVLIGLQNEGITASGADIDEQLDAGFSKCFMYHGLGHFMGMTVHDVGGYTKEFPKIEKEPYCWLRTTRTLQSGMVITVEPGVYFNLPWLHSQISQNPKFADWLNMEYIAKEYRDFGGVRIEDDVLVTREGCKNLTLVPRTCSDIEELMRGD